MNTTAHKNDPRRLAALAAVLNLLIPGVGHFLLGLRLRGAIWIGGWVLLASTAGVAGAHFTFALAVIAAADAYLMARTLAPPAEDEHPNDLTNMEDRR